MDQERFINAMRDSMFSGYLGGKGPRDRLGPILARLSEVAPFVGRVSIIFLLICGVYRIYQVPPIILICVTGAILYVKRNSFRPVKHGTLLGSAAWMTHEKLKAGGFFDGQGLVLGRARDTKPSRVRALFHLAFKPFRDSEAVLRRFITVWSRGWLDLTRARDQPLITLPTYKHALLVGPAGSGKGVSYIIPIILSYAHAMVIADHKGGENWLKTSGQRRKRGFNEVRLDCYSVRGPGSDSINIFDMLDSGDPMVVANCRMLANSLIPRGGGEHQHFVDSARELLTAVLLFVACCAPEELRHLSFVRHILSDLSVLKKCFAKMIESRDLGGILAEMGARHLHIPEREFGSILSTTMLALSFLQDPLVAAHVERSSFDIRATTRNTTTYMILPISLMSSHSALIRMYLIAFTLAKKEEGLGEQNEVMYMIDEAGSLGDLEPLEGAIHTGRGVGIRVMLAVQSIKLVDANFPGARGEAIIADTDVKIFNGINDYPTAKLVSDMAGEETINVVTGNEGTSTSGGGMSSPLSFGSSQGYNQSPSKRPLVTPDVVMRSPRTAYIFTAGNDPIIATPVLYYSDEAFLGVDGNRSPSRLSVPSLIIASLGVLVMLYLGLGMAWESLPAISGRIAISSPAIPAAVEAVVPPTRVAVVPPFVLDALERRPALPAPRWPSVALCPRCKARYDLDGYEGQLLQCEDCSAHFRVPKQ